MFIGEFYHKIDTKGRVSVPSSFRSAAQGTQYYVTYGPDVCLFAYDDAGFKRQTDLLNKLDDSIPKVRAMKRVFFSGSPQECDDHGRIKLSAQFIAHSHIKKDVVMMGMQDHFEIWSQEIWDKQHQQDISNYNENYGNMSTLVRTWAPPPPPVAEEAAGQDHNGGA